MVHNQVLFIWKLSPYYLKNVPFISSSIVSFSIISLRKTSKLLKHWRRLLKLSTLFAFIFIHFVINKYNYITWKLQIINVMLKCNVPLIIYYTSRLVFSLPGSMSSTSGGGYGWNALSAGLDSATADWSLPHGRYSLQNQIVNVKDL